jgi:S1-C subfamily serine protease
MTPNLRIRAALATFALAGILSSSFAIGQDATSDEAARLENRREQLDAARERMDRARRDLESAAREVAELSAGTVQPLGRNFTLGFRGLPVQRAALGVNIVDAPGESGVRVLGVAPGGAAAEAGVLTGDVIVGIDDTALANVDGSSAELLIRHMGDVQPGQEVELQVLRDGQARTIAVTPGENEHGFAFVAGGPGDAVVPAVPGLPYAGAGPNVTFNAAPNVRRFNLIFGGRWNDLELVPLTEQLGSYFGTSEGLLVVKAPDDDALGLQGGDVIIDIGGRAPASPEHAMRILLSFEPGETLRLTILRRERRQQIEYVIPDEPRIG